jgi:hypothetical protein
VQLLGRFVRERGTATDRYLRTRVHARAVQQLVAVRVIPDPSCASFPSLDANYWRSGRSGFVQASRAFASVLMATVVGGAVAALRRLDASVNWARLTAPEAVGGLRRQLR